MSQYCESCKILQDKIVEQDGQIKELKETVKWLTSANDDWKDRDEKTQAENERLNKLLFAYESTRSPVNPLLAENKRLKEELEEHRSMIFNKNKQIADQQALIGQLEKEKIEALMEAGKWLAEAGNSRVLVNKLQELVTHKIGCSFYLNGTVAFCDCGLNAALAAVESAKPEQKVKADFDPADLSMDILKTKAGDKVVYCNLTAGLPPDQEQASKYLRPMLEYTIQTIDIHDWHTDVYFVEVEGVAFNSVLFKNINEQEAKDKALLDDIKKHHPNFIPAIAIKVDEQEAKCCAACISRIGGKCLGYNCNGCVDYANLLQY